MAAVYIYIFTRRDERPSVHGREGGLSGAERGTKGHDGSAEGESGGESYFWLLSRKSNLRSLTPKELQMHGRQHTGVSIYEARTREKDESSGRRGEASGRNGRW